MDKNSDFFKKPLGECLAVIRAHILEARSASPLAAGETQIMGASKMQNAETIDDAIRAGLNLFGENRVQEAVDKWPEIKARHPDVKLHLIGPLQTNKVKDAVRLFDAIQTVDREKLVDVLAKELAGKEGLSTKEFFVQINTGEESQKGGVIPKDAGRLIEYAKVAGMNVSGLMCIPPEGEYPAPHFALLREIALEHNLKELSMGMSGDYALAARMGATIVRVGSALFGERKMNA